MRPVIHVVDSLGLGGCQTCLKAMMEHSQGPRQHYVVSLRYIEPHVEINRGPVLCAPSTSRFSPLSLFPLLRLARQLGDPIIHCYLFRSQVYGFLVKSLDSRCRLILHEGGRIVQREHEPAWERVAYRVFLRTAGRSSDMFLANSRYTMSRLEAAGHRGRLPSRVVYNCILTETRASTRRVGPPRVPNLDYRPPLSRSGLPDAWWNAKDGGISWLPPRLCAIARTYIG